MPKTKLKIPYFQTEQRFETWVRQRLKEIPESYWLPKNNTFSRRGVPDIVGQINGYFVALELKLDDARHDPSRELLQEYEIQKIVAAGSVIALSRVTPSQWNEVEECLQDLVDGKFTPKN
jgi:hypothetical protein